MSDTSANLSTSTATSDPFGAPPSERWYRVVGVGLDADGALRLTRREYLSRPTFDRAGAVRHVSAEAKKLEDANQSLGFVNERNKLLGLFVAKTGRSASRDLKSVVKSKLEIDRKVAKAEARAAKRTSRPARKLTSRAAKPASVLSGLPIAKKRTSRKPKKV